MLAVLCLAGAGAQDMQWIDTLDFFWDSLPDGDQVCGCVGELSLGLCKAAASYQQQCSTPTPAPAAAHPQTEVYQMVIGCELSLGLCTN
jgi:hypothetical protein